ncbi:MAG: tRNA lysidine(34) synthetase TilS [Acidobacteria bacterium]|nr:MAG: tRNA lysidine(34) synthetase TilS [Acidobacteriota bacterium]
MTFSEAVQSACRFVSEKEMLKPGDIVVAGVSGGADSVLLFHVLLAMGKSMGIRLIVAHLNHGLRPEADEEMDFVREMCRKHAIPFHVGRIPRGVLAEVTGKSIEMAARDSRKRFLNAVAMAAGASKIALGHTGSDHVETMLMNIHRGTGLRGLAGIQPVREKIIRPLIFFQGSEIRDSLRENGIAFVEDGSNCDPKFLRNRVRGEIMPKMTEVFGMNSLKKWNQLSENTINALKTLRFLLREFLAGGMGRDPSGLRVDRDIFLLLPESSRREGILFLLEEIAGSTVFATRENVNRLARFFRGQGFGIVEIEPDIRVVRSSRWMYFLKKVPEVSIEVHEIGNYNSWFQERFFFSRLETESDSPVDDDVLIVDEELFPFPYRLEPVDLQKNYLIRNGREIRNVRDFMKKAGLGKAERDWMPVLKKGKRILWIPGVTKLVENGKAGSSGNRIAVYFRH